MKRILLILGVLLSFCAGAQIDKVIPGRPSPPKLVNDFTKTLTVEQVVALERKLVAFDDSTSNQVAIVLIPTTDGNAIEDVALQLGREWGWVIKTGTMGLYYSLLKTTGKQQYKLDMDLKG